ncbi:hypothetical protein QB910_000112 [Dabrowskivirus KKP3916]|uniref:HTH cro/C1-type domain-containing protein n=1 Tax=Alicyclobacillus phage KKP_3916 TaxID=3040651 RepID=A0AAT9V7R9_9CAUD|nr:hypothetical protein QB910_000112 [Alicyclobacillus phage KKP 3916]
MSGKVKNKFDVVLDRHKFDALIGDMFIKDFYDRINVKWKLGIDYKSFLNLVNNRVNWRLIHAYAIADMLDCRIEDIFKVTEVDIEERERKRKMERESKLKAMTD